MTGSILSHAEKKTFLKRLRENNPLDINVRDYCLS